MIRKSGVGQNEFVILYDSQNIITKKYHPLSLTKPNSKLFSSEMKLENFNIIQWLKSDFSKYEKFRIPMGVLQNL